MEKGTSRLTASIEPSELEAWLTLTAIPSLGDQKVAILVQRFGGPREALEASVREWAQVLHGDVSRLAHGLAQARARPVAKQVEVLRRGNYRLYTLWDEDYPPLLRDISSPPVLLYTRGSFSPADQRAVAIVGSRAATDYGQRIAYDLASGVAKAGMTVVSGLARGVDSWAHRGALDGGGRTVAVLGNGPDVAYPPENIGLMEDVANGGVVVSEFPPLTPPNPKHFPRRNRVIAGLSLGVVVVQARESSGALITAQHALEQGREVMAVPGPVNARTSRGPHWLIKQGAALVEDVDDVLAALGQPLVGRAGGSEPKALPPLDEQELSLLRLLGSQPVHIDQLCAQTQEPSGQLLARLLQLELKGVVKQLAGKQFLSLVAQD